MKNVFREPVDERKRNVLCRLLLFVLRRKSFDVKVLRRRMEKGSPTLNTHTIYPFQHIKNRLLAELVRTLDELRLIELSSLLSLASALVHISLLCWHIEFIIFIFISDGKKDERRHDEMRTRLIISKQDSVNMSSSVVSNNISVLSCVLNIILTSSGAANICYFIIYENICQVYDKYLISSDNATSSPSTARHQNWIWSHHTFCKMLFCKFSVVVRMLLLLCFERGWWLSTILLILWWWKWVAV